jgi:hypothetical protein
MRALLQRKRLLFALMFFTCISIVAMANKSEAGPIQCEMRGSIAGAVGGGKQLVQFTGRFINTSRNEYISGVNWVNVEVHGYFNGREEKYTRKVDVNHNFSSILEPGQRKDLKISFKRKVDPQRGMFPYDDVEVKVLNINFNRAS